MVSGLVRLASRLRRSRFTPRSSSSSPSLSNTFCHRAVFLVRIVTLAVWLKVGGDFDEALVDEEDPSETRRTVVGELVVVQDAAAAAALAATVDGPFRFIGFLSKSSSSSLLSMTKMDGLGLAATGAVFLEACGVLAVSGDEAELAEFAKAASSAVFLGRFANGGAE